MGLTVNSEFNVAICFPLFILEFTMILHTCVEFKIVLQGVGAVGLQYLLHLFFLRCIRSLFAYGSRALGAPQRGPIPSNISHRASPVNSDLLLSSSSSEKDFIAGEPKYPLTGNGPSFSP